MGMRPVLGDTKRNAVQGLRIAYRGLHQHDRRSGKLDTHPIHHSRPLLHRILVTACNIETLPPTLTGRLTPCLRS
jgi:hypothetical protein